MGDRLTEKKPEQTSQTPYGDTFDRLAPQYMAMGMTWDEYWDGEFGTKRAFREAYRLRMENERRTADINNWYMGQYIIGVLQSVPLLVAGLNVKRTTSLPSYPEKPFLLQAEEKKKEEVRKKHEEDQSKLAMAMFHAIAEQFNKNFRKRQEQKKSEETGQ